MSLLASILWYVVGPFMMAAFIASWWWLYDFRRTTLAHRSAENGRAAEILVRLQELASCVAFDVDEHSQQVEEINASLTSAAQDEPTMIVDVVAKLIQANHHMQEKLASTEEKLRDQAQQIQVHAAEARTDALTLLANRRSLDDELARRIAEHRRHGRTFSLIMADVDWFKRFNDAHGHQLGDEVLRTVAKILRRKMRTMDLVARYGGEEFAIILPGTNLDDASNAARRACEAIATCQFCPDAKDLRVTVSFGVGEVRGNEDGVMLVARADAALYAAKEGGRNCVFRHDGEFVTRVGGNKGCVVSESQGQPPSRPLPSAHEDISAPRRETIATEPKPVSSYTIELDAAPDLPCRTTFCQQVRNRTAEWKRGGPHFSVILIEVDRVQPAGQDCGLRTREVSALTARQFLAATVREMDFVGDYAPGCFALLLPTSGLADAIRVVERLREGLSQCVPTAESKQPRLTLSAGVVQVAEKDDSLSLLKRAEAALDAAGREGGNRAYYHDGERCTSVAEMLETMDSVS